MTEDKYEPLGDASRQASKFKNASGARYTRGLFLETTENLESALYTLKEYDHQSKPSLKRLYLEGSDTTEWDFANRYLDNYSHWKQLTETSWFKPIVAEWREELRLKLKIRISSPLIEYS